MSARSFGELAKFARIVESEIEATHRAVLARKPDDIENLWAHVNFLKSKVSFLADVIAEMAERLQQMEP